MPPLVAKPPAVLGVKQRKTLRVDMPTLPPGAVIRATDRNYVIQRNGSWVRRDREEELPARKSMVYLAHPSRPPYVHRTKTTADPIPFNVAR